MQMRVYTSTMKTSSISAAKTLAYLTTSSNALCVLLSAEVVAPDVAAASTSCVIVDGTRDAPRITPIVAAGP